MNMLAISFLMIVQMTYQCCVNGSIGSAERTDDQEAQKVIIKMPLVLALERIGEEHDRHFTIEQAWRDREPANWLENFMVPTPALGRKINGSDKPTLHEDLQAIAIPGVKIEVDALNPKVIHVMDQRLGSAKHYPLRQELSDFSFDGTTRDLVKKLSTINSAISFKATFAIGGPPIAVDMSTVVKLRGFSGTVRQALTLAVPLENYSRVVWISTARLGSDNILTEVNYRGEKGNQTNDKGKRTNE